MKTSIVAVIAAGVFLVAALVGLGSGHMSAPTTPETIVLTAPSADVTASASLRPNAAPGPALSPFGLPQVVPVGRAVKQQNLNDILAAGPHQSAEPQPSGPLQVAAGQPAPQGTQSFPVQVSTSISPGIGSPSSSPPRPRPKPTYVSPSPRPRPKPRPTPTPTETPTPPPPVVTPSPTPTPSASPSVTATATPPVTGTATP